MEDRDLHLIEHDNGVVEAEFIRYPPYGTPHYVRRLLMRKEISKAREVMESKNEYDIDAFCYSIV